MSLRTRLALFIAVSIAVALLVQGATGYLSFRQQAYASLDRDLSLYLERVEQEVSRGERGDPRRFGPLASLPEDYVARARVIYEGEVVAQNEGFPAEVGLEPLQHPQTIGVWRVGSAMPRPQTPELVIQAAVSSREVVGGLIRYRRTLFVTVLGVSFLGAVIALLLSRPALRPLQHLLITARRVASSGDLSLRVPAGGTGELAELSATFNHMLERLSAFRERESTFTRSASHELRTPLTAMRLHLDSQREGYTTTEETFAALEQEVNRMTRLSAALLTLAREGRAERVSVDLAALATEIAEEAGVPYEGLARLELSGDPLLLRQALGNLLDNAAKYAPDAAVTLRLETHSDAGERFAVLSVTDTGPGLSEDDRARAGEAFYRVPGTLVQGSGLGLAVASQVAEAHGGRLELRSNTPRGLRVELWLRLEGDVKNRDDSSR